MTEGDVTHRAVHVGLEVGYAGSLLNNFPNLDKRLLDDVLGLVDVADKTERIHAQGQVKGLELMFEPGAGHSTRPQR